MSYELTKDLSAKEMFQLILQRMDAQDARMTMLEQKFEQRMDLQDARMTVLENKFATLERKVEDRWYDTRPNWSWLTEQIDTMQRQLATINNQLEVLTQDVMQVRTAQRGLERRVTVLEQQQAA